MFQDALLTGHSLVLFFLRKPDVRRDINIIEDILKYNSHYKQPSVVSVPDDLDPNIPRVIFESNHGFSQIIISQVNIAFNVRYTEEWQKNYKLGKDYVNERAHLIFEILHAIDRHALYAGISSVVTMPTVASDEDIIERLYKHYQKGADTSSVFDFEIKRTTVQNDKYFSNIHIKNFREWSLRTPAFEGSRFKQGEATKRGVQILGDFNDRFGFNEIEGYETNRETCKDIVEKSLSAIQCETEKLREATNAQ